MIQKEPICLTQSKKMIANLYEAQNLLKEEKKRISLMTDKEKEKQHSLDQMKLFFKQVMKQL